MTRGRVRLLSAPAAFLAALVALALPNPAAAQQGVTTGAIQGRIVDNTGSPLAEATVTVREVETGRERQVQTGGDGRYMAGFLPPGSYVVRAEFPPLEAIERGPVEVSLGVTRTIDIALQPVEVAAIAVRMGAEQVDVTQGGVVELVDEEQIANLPALGRDFTDFINLSGLVSPTPEVTTGGQFSLGGGRTSATNIQIDGVDANNSFFGENRGSSRIPFTFSLESIKEFQIITNGFDVEFGNYTGGVVNAVTKGGTNNLEGSAFVYRRDEALTSDGFDGLPPVDFQATQFGLRLGGPIIEDKAHWFVSVDGQQKDQPLQALTAERWGGSADSIARFRDILRTVYGVSDVDQNIGLFEETEDELAIFGRLDWAFNDRNTLTLRHNYSDFEQQNDRISPEEARTHGGPFEDTSNSTVAELTSVFGERGQAYNVARLQYSYEDRPRPGNDYLPEVDVRIDSNAPAVEYFGDGILFRNRLEETKVQFIDNYTWQTEDGRHTVKVGTNNTWTGIDNLFWLNGNGEFRFSNLADFAAMRPNRFQRTTRADGVEPRAKFDISEHAIYAQDEMRIGDKITLAVGLRYDMTVFRDEAEPALVPSIGDTFGVRTEFVPEDRDNVSPRVAFTYDLKGDATSVIRAGAGLLYGRMPFVLHGNVMQSNPPLGLVTCTGADIPAVDYDLFRQAPRGENNPLRCRSGAAPGGRPEFSVWDPDFENPESWKLNLGFEQVFEGEGMLGGLRASVDLLYGKTENNFNVRQVNLKPVQFRTAIDDRPVFVVPASFGSLTSSGFFVNQPANLNHPSIGNVFLNESTSESEAWSVTLKGARELFEGLRLDTSYTYNHVFDNSSFFCCTSFEGFSSKPTAGDPNFIGDPGDDDEGTWGPASFERRHVFIVSGTWDGPWGIEVGGIWRSQSGTPWTMTVQGDLNGDTDSFNDRAPVFENLRFRNETEAAQWNDLLTRGTFTTTDAQGNTITAGENDAGECLQEELGRIAHRNSCRNPWFHSVDLHLAKAFGFMDGHEVEVVADLFNVLNGLNEDWGQFVAVFTDRASPLEKVGFDPATREVIFSVNDRFGETRTSGFKPLQFQAQLGLRYRF